MSSFHIKPKHDIFVSHSGAQKDFVIELCAYLRRASFSTFLDVTDHSLPPGHDFPSLIFDAARTCRLALLVLSHEYLLTKWPMIELCAFVAANPQPKILPLFFKLSPADLKLEHNKAKWRQAWQSFADSDPSRIHFSEWESAFAILSSQNGIRIQISEGDHAYIARVCSSICRILPSSMSHDFSGLQGLHRMSQVVLAKFEELNKGQSSTLPVSVLGMHGLPGSGKSILCRYLCDLQFFEFGGKRIRLELPTDANDEELLLKSKELLTQLTNFNDKMCLTKATDFRQVYAMLKGTDFLTSRVFLVVDNISSRDSVNAVKAILRLGLAPGSVVLLVARTLAVLKPLLQHDNANDHCYVYDSMPVPSLNEIEALRVLLQSGDGMGLINSYEPEAGLTPGQRQVMEEVVSISTNGGKHILPLVLKIMGELLTDLADLENWKGQIKDMNWTKVWLCKEKSLTKLVEKSFKVLSQKLQYLFLDVALFLFPLSYLDGESHYHLIACEYLGFIHGCMPDEIEIELRELQKRCFITIWEGVISVHDVYLEFATSVEEASMYYWSSGHRWGKVQRTRAALQVGSGIKLRTVVWDQVGEEELVLLSSEFSSVRAIVLRNCKSLKTLWGFANLKLLASLEIHNCPNLKWVESPPAIFGSRQQYYQESLQRVKWVNNELQDCHLGRTLMLDGPLQDNILEGPPRYSMGSLVFQMRNLQILKLENIGIRESVNISDCWLQLRVLELRERHIPQFHACNLPNLVRFLFFGDGKPCSPCEQGSVDGEMTGFARYDVDEYGYAVMHKMTSPAEGACMIGKGFLKECPKLQDVYVHCASAIEEDEYSSAMLLSIASEHLKSLRVDRFWNLSRLPNLKASANSLEQLLVQDCPQLTNLDFGCDSYTNLRILLVCSCPNLSEVTGLGRLSRLSELRIFKCASLRRVNGLDGLAGLVDFTVGIECPKLGGVLDIQNSTKLRNIAYFAFCPSSQLNLKNFVNLNSLNLQWSTDRVVHPEGMFTGFECVKSLKYLYLQCTDSTNNSCAAAPALDPMDLASLLGVAALPSRQLRMSSSITSLNLNGLRSLTSLNGIEFMHALNDLELKNLQSLSCLRGIESLSQLEALRLQCCASVEELPSLSRLAKLRCLVCQDCVELKSVEGCSGRSLYTAHFKGCTSLVRCPIGWETLGRPGFSLEIEGSKFASVKKMVGWVEDYKKVPPTLRRASLQALKWEFLENRREDTEGSREMALVVLDSVVEFARRKYPAAEDEDEDDDDDISSDIIGSWLGLLEAGERYRLAMTFSADPKEKEYGARAVEKIVERVARMPKERLRQHCIFDTLFQRLVVLLFCRLYHFANYTIAEYSSHLCLDLDRHTFDLGLFDLDDPKQRQAMMDIEERTTSNLQGRERLGRELSLTWYR